MNVFVCVQSCPTLCNPMDSSPPGSSVHGIFQAKILELVAVSFSRGPSPPRDQTLSSSICRQILYHCAIWKNHISCMNQLSSVQLLSCVQLFATPWTAAHRASLSITNSQSLLKLMSTELVMPSNHLIFKFFQGKIVFFFFFPQY